MPLHSAPRLLSLTHIRSYRILHLTLSSITSCIWLQSEDTTSTQTLISGRAAEIKPCQPTILNSPLILQTSYGPFLDRNHYLTYPATKSLDCASGCFSIASPSRLYKRTWLASGEPGGLLSPQSKGTSKSRALVVNHFHAAQIWANYLYGLCGRACVLMRWSRRRCGVTSK